MGTLETLGAFSWSMNKGFSIAKEKKDNIIKSDRSRHGIFLWYLITLLKRIKTQVNARIFNILN